jgi:hypothetical protein
MKSPLLDRRPLTFAACVVLFFVSSAGWCPASRARSQGGARNSPRIARN